jgi:two-component system OmpR family response regulator
MPLLLIEDDVEAARLLIENLHEQGYEVEHAADGRAGLDLAFKKSWDLIIADRMLPHVDGLDIVHALRAQGRKTPILILSALAEIDDRVRGLKAGGDDYLTKPYAVVELQARVAALLRRSALNTDTRLKAADLEIDLMSRTARRHGRDITLTHREFDLLAFLMQREGQVVTRKMLLERVWDLHFDPQTNVIDVHMSRLRQAVDKGFDPPLIHTIRGAGYMFGVKN